MTLTCHLLSSEIPLEYCNELTFIYGNVVVAKINHPPCWSFLVSAGVREIIMITIDRIRGWAFPAGRGLSCHELGSLYDGTNGVRICCGNDSREGNSIGAEAGVDSDACIARKGLEHAILVIHHETTEVFLTA